MNPRLPLSNVCSRKLPLPRLRAFSQYVHGPYCIHIYLSLTALQTRERRLPSYTFVSAYFAAFRPREFILVAELIMPDLYVLCCLRTGPLPTLPEVPTTGDSTLILALQALEATDYAHALSFVNEALDQGISWDVGKAEALNLRGTFKYVNLKLMTTNGSPLRLVLCSFGPP